MVYLRDYLLQMEISQSLFAELSEKAEKDSGEYPLSYGTIVKIYGGEKVSSGSCIKAIRAIKLWLRQQGLKVGSSEFTNEINKIHFL